MNLRSRILWLSAATAWLMTVPAGAQEFATPPDRVVVTADRMSTSPADGGVEVRAVERADLDAAPAARLDDILREQIPGFSLFRRSSSRVANPTTQGVSLRNIGPNGAGRTLVLLDGVPQNDPFGGWVYWGRLPPSAIERVEVVQGGGAGLFGNAALGGTIELFSRQFAGDALTVDTQGGSRETYEASIAGQRSVASGALVLSARADRFSTDGYPTIQADQRGAVDIAADSEETLFEAGARWNINATTALTFKADAFREDRVNGTPLTSNSTDAADFSASLDGELPDRRIAYQLQGYGQLREYQSTFSAVNLARSAETPSLDQYSVPAQSAGGSATVSLPLGEANRVLVGADERWVEGETDERFRYLAGAFTRRREAGGRQFFTGLFVEDDWKPAPGSTVAIAGRLDHYTNDDGSRRETDLATGLPTLNEKFDAQDGWEPNGRIGGTQQLWNENTRLRGSFYTGYRVPTLNELYRPFRVGNDITEANAALQPERLYGVDLGLETNPVKTVHASLGGFYNELHDPVANVTVAGGGASVAPFGFIPVGGVGRLRENLGRAQVYGAEAAATWTPSPQWVLSLSYLYSHGVVESAPAQPTLEGKRLAQAPEHQLVASVRWSAWKHLQALGELRVVGDQFEDDLNTLRLDAFATVDLSLVYSLPLGLEARAAVENLFDTEIQTGKSASDLVSIGAPRLLTFGLRWNY